MSATRGFIISVTFLMKNKNPVYYINIMTAFRQTSVGKSRGKSSNKKRSTSRKYVRRGRTMRVGKYKRRGRTARGGKYKRRGRTARRSQSGGVGFNGMRDIINSGNYSIKIVGFQPGTTIGEIASSCLRRLTCPSITIFDKLTDPQQDAMGDLYRRAQTVGKSNGASVDAIRITQNINGESISGIITVDMLLRGLLLKPNCPEGVPCANARPVLWMMSSPPDADPVLPNGFSSDSENTVLTDSDSMLTWPVRDVLPTIGAPPMMRDPVDDLVTSMAHIKID